MFCEVEMIVLCIYIIQMRSITKIILIVLLISICNSIDPPVWPPYFTQSFQEKIITTSTVVTGILYYDALHNRMRVDRLDGRFEPLCNSSNPNTKTACIQIVVDDKLYLHYPQNRSCCMCCTADHGCGVTPRDWLKNAKYQGQAELEGQTYYEWSTQKAGIQVLYYTVKNQQYTPRQINYVNYKWLNFQPSTYSQNEIDPHYFTLPPYCDQNCSSQSLCGKLRTQSPQSQQNLKNQ